MYSAPVHSSAGAFEWRINRMEFRAHPNEREFVLRMLRREHREIEERLTGATNKVPAIAELRVLKRVGETLGVPWHEVMKHD
jgi:hypothetical protein